MKIVIWGIGERGKRIYSRLEPNEVIAFIDSNSDKIGTEYKGKKVISLNEYLQNFSQYFILISPVKTDEIKYQLQEHGITQYFDLKKAPVELQYNEGYVYLERFVRKIGCDKKCGIYGTEFYSIYLFDKLMSMGNNNLYLIPEVGMSANKVDAFQRAFPYIKILKEINKHDAIERLYITTRDQYAVSALNKMASSCIEIYDIFDLSCLIEEYWNTELKKFKNIHEGECCFIVATGPSLCMEDLETLRKNNIKSIGMNRVYLAFKESEWRPDYYVVNDSYCLSESFDELKRLPVGSIFLADTYPEIWEQNVPSNVYKYHSHPSRMYDDNIPFSSDIIKAIYTCGTVTYCCIQLAAYMGFKKIMLLGVDFNLSDDYKNKNNHFAPDYYTSESKVREFFEKESLQAFESAQKYAREHGIKIYNATRGGRLEVFERVDFDSLFN